MSGFTSLLPRAEPFPDVFQAFQQGRANELNFRKGEFDLGDAQRKQQQELELNSLAPDLLSPDPAVAAAARARAYAVAPSAALGLETAQGNNRRADVTSGINQQDLALRQQQAQSTLEEHISRMTDADRARAAQNVQIMGQLGGSLMSLPDPGSRVAAWPSVRDQIMRQTGIDPGVTYPGDAKIQQFLLQAQSPESLFKVQQSTFANPWTVPGIGAPATSAPSSGTSQTTAPIPGAPSQPVGPGAAPVQVPPSGSAAASSPYVVPNNGRQPTAQEYAGPLGNLIQSSAAKYGISPEIATGLVRVESGGNPNAVGPQTRYGSAKGLTQVLDSTFKEMGGDPSRIHQPADNLDAGMGYLAKMRDKYGGNMPIALAAYNWGPGNVDNWLRSIGGDMSKLPPTVQQYISRVTGAFPQASNAPWQSGQMPTAMPPGQFPRQTTPADLGLIGSAPAGYTGPPGAEGPPPMVDTSQAAPAVAPVPVSAALGGNTAVGQAVNAGAAQQLLSPMQRLMVPGNPDQLYSVNARGDYEPVAHSPGKVYAWDRRTQQKVEVWPPNALESDVAKTSAIKQAEEAVKPPTEAQSKDGIYARRMAMAENDLSPVEDVLHKPLALLGSKVSNYTTPEALQLAKQAKDNFITAALRKESGAVISDSDFARDEKKYFPQFGDSPAVIAQKQRLRAAVIDEMRNSAGPAGARVPQVNQIPQIVGDLDYAKVKSGTTYRAPDGTIRTKQ